MKPLTVAVLGAGGQLGSTLIADWSLPAKESRFKLHAFNREQLDINSSDSLASTLSPLALDLVINAAAYTAVDRAETEADRAMQTNRDGAASVAAWARSNHCKLIHVSTDFVFDGRSRLAYRPDDQTAPLNVYGASKLAGEQAIRALYAEGSFIIRTSWLYSAYGNNFVKTMLRLMVEKDHLRIVRNQFGSPTSTHSLVNLIDCVGSSSSSGGTFHWSDSGVISWYDFAVAIQEEALAVSLLNKSIKIEPINSREYPTVAARPEFSVLDTSLSRDTFECVPVHWRDNLRTVIKEMAEKKL